MRIVRTGHGNGVFVISQTVGRLIGNGSLNAPLLLKAAQKTASLDHKALDNAMKNRPVVKARGNVLFKVFASYGRFFRIKFNINYTFIGRQTNHFAFLVVSMMRTDLMRTGVTGTSE